ncbi:hypothetical protein JCM8208_001562 [Rhodotorula glutinis]
MSSSESDDDSGIFAGLTFFIHGQWAGRTYGRVARLVTDNGGRVVKDVSDVDLSHAIVSGQLWSRQGSVSADITIRAIVAANEDNRSEADENQNRVWLLPLEFVEESIEAGEKLDERKHDFERTAEVRAAQRAKEIREENKAYGGKSRFGRGERKRWEREQVVKKELALQAKIDKQGIKPDLDAFSGLSSVAAPSSTTAVTPHPTTASSSLKQDVLKPKLDSKAPTSAKNKDKAARAAERRKKEAKAAAAAARNDSKPLKPTSSSKPATEVGKKKLKRKRSSAPVIPVIRDYSSDEDLPVVGASKPRSRSPSSSGGKAKSKEREVLVVASDTESDDVRQVAAKKKKKTAPVLRDVSPEL